MTEENKEVQETKKTPAKKGRPKKTETKAPEEKVEKRVIKDSDEVTVYNNRNITVLYEAKKGTGYLRMTSFMDSDTMTVEELKQMRNTSRGVLTKGWIYVDDEEVLDYLRLSDLKEKVMSPSTLEELVQDKNTRKVKEVAPKLSRASKVAMYDILKKKYKSGEVSNMHLIKEIEKAVGVDSLDSLLNAED